MGNNLEKMGAGLYVRRDTPKHVRLSRSFIEKVTRGEKPSAFKEAIKEMANREK